MQEPATNAQTFAQFWRSFIIDPHGSLKVETTPDSFLAIWVIPTSGHPRPSEAVVVFRGATSLNSATLSGCTPNQVTINGLRRKSRGTSNPLTSLANCVHQAPRPTCTASGHSSKRCHRNGLPRSRIRRRSVSPARSSKLRNASWNSRGPTASTIACVSELIAKPFTPPAPATPRVRRHRVLTFLIFRL